MGLSDSALSLVEHVRQQLEPDGWTVSVREPHEAGGRWISVACAHPLCGDSGSGLNFPDDEDDHRPFVEGYLTKREFAVIRARPDPCPHAALMGTFRQAAGAQGWDLGTLAIVARVLRSNELLTDAEAKWLEDAGPAWWHDGE